MRRHGHLWVVILAAGEGSRVKGLTRDRRGRRAPKQFSLIDGRSTLLDITLDRARKLAPAARIVAVVARHHRQWWRSELAVLPVENVIVQPENRGTAAGVLLPLLWILHRDPEARIVVLPSDHGVRSERILHDAVEGAVASTPRCDSEMVLLGVQPDRPETDYGWIVPGAATPGRLHRVKGFREKPDAATASDLMAEGGLLNSFILATGGRFLLERYETVLPRLWGRFQSALYSEPHGFRTGADLTSLYRSLPSFDFSKDLLERRTDRLWVYPMPACGWLDLGAPERLTGHLISRGQRGRQPDESTWNSSPAPIHRLRVGDSDSATRGHAMNTNAFD